MGVAARACCCPSAPYALTPLSVRRCSCSARRRGVTGDKDGQRKGEKCAHGGWGVGMARWVVRRRLLSGSLSNIGRTISYRSNILLSARNLVRGPCTCAQSARKRRSTHRVRERDAASDLHPVQHVPSAPVTRGPVGGEAQGAESGESPQNNARAHGHGAGWGASVQVLPRPQGP